MTLSQGKGRKVSTMKAYARVSKRRQQQTPEKAVAQGRQSSIRIANRVGLKAKAAQKSNPFSKTRRQGNSKEVKRGLKEEVLVEYNYSPSDAEDKNAARSFYHLRSRCGKQNGKGPITRRRAKQMIEEPCSSSFYLSKEYIADKLISIPPLSPHSCNSCETAEHISSHIDRLSSDAECQTASSRKLQLGEEKNESPPSCIIEAFLSKCEAKNREAQMKFQKKYNFDIENSKPYRGRYKWSTIHVT